MMMIGRWSDFRCSIEFGLNRGTALTQDSDKTVRFFEQPDDRCSRRTRGNARLNEFQPEGGFVSLFDRYAEFRRDLTI